MISTAAACAGTAGATAAGDTVVTVADNDRLGRGIEDIVGRHPAFKNHDSGIGDEARYRHGPIGPSGVAANHVSITLRYRDEYNALLRLLAAEGEAVSA